MVVNDLLPWVKHHTSQPMVVNDLLPWVKHHTSWLMVVNDLFLRVKHHESGSTGCPLGQKSHRITMSTDDLPHLAKHHTSISMATDDLLSPLVTHHTLRSHYDLKKFQSLETFPLTSDIDSSNYSKTCSLAAQLWKNFKLHFFPSIIFWCCFNIIGFLYG